MIDVVLEYIGNGDYFINVPARDLTEEDILNSGLTAKQLVGSGLYRYIKQPAKPIKDKVEKEN